MIYGNYIQQENKMIMRDFFKYHEGTFLETCCDNGSFFVVALSRSE